MTICWLQEFAIQLKRGLTINIKKRVNYDTILVDPDQQHKIKTS